MSGSNVTSLHTLFDAVREKYSISLDPLVMGKVSMKDLMDCYGLEAFKIGFNGNDLCHNVFPKAVKRWVMGENENVPLVLSYDPISDEFSTLMNSYIVNSAVRFMDGQFPVLLHPGEKRRRYEPYHVAWYQRQGTRGSLRTTYGDPMVWAWSKNFFLTAVVPIEIYCRLSPRQFRAIIRRREKEGWQYDDSADHDLEKEAIDLCKRHSVLPHKVPWGQFIELEAKK
ncbi:hypothetical protein BT69DRAFT_1342079 [Atractiella rhizophila]|nr:hypothetical protein BT69DRAFT_1342079 [Atractiella rhizophila]